MLTTWKREQVFRQFIICVWNNQEHTGASRNLCRKLFPLTYRDSRSREGQAKQHEERDHLMHGLDIGHAQAAVIAAVAGAHRLEHICQLEEVQADHWRRQDWELQPGEKEQQESPEVSPVYNGENSPNK